MEAETFKIDEVASRLGTSVRTLRNYEEQGLVRPLRTSGGTRLHSAEHIDRLRAALHLADCGLPIQDIAALCRARQSGPTGDAGSQAVSRRLQERLRIPGQRIGELRALREKISAARRVVARCRGCTHVPNSRGCPHCPVREQRADINVFDLLRD